MDRLGIPTLNAGAPDLRLSGEHNIGSYVQRRRAQMAYGGIAGLDGRMQYGIGSWFQKKIKDPIKEKIVDPVIDLVTDNPMLATLGGGALLNQFGIPFTGTAGDRMGQNWLGELLGNVGGTGTIDMVLGKGGTGQTLSEGVKNMLGIDVADWRTPGIGGMDDAGLPEDWKKRLATQVMEPTFFDNMREGTTKEGALKYARDLLLGNQYGGALTGGIGSQFQQFLGGQGIQPTTTQRTGTGQYPPINWKTPLAIGSAIGAADYLTRSDDTMPEQLSIDPSRFKTAAAAMADEDLRFKPETQYALAADGGRIGYENGGLSELFDEMGPSRDPGFLKDPFEHLSEEEKETLKRRMEIMNKGFLRDPFEGMSEEEIEMIKNQFKIREQQRKDMGLPEGVQLLNQGGRIGYENGGLTDYQIFKLKELGYGKAGSNPGSYGGVKILKDILKLHNYAQGGRIGYQTGKKVGPSETEKGLLALIRKLLLQKQGEEVIRPYSTDMLSPFNRNFKGDEGILAPERDFPPDEGIYRDPGDWKERLRKRFLPEEEMTMAAQGGRIGADEGGLMNLGGMEKDYRQEGGFVPIGGEEKADDVPARLSKNEFVFTADAVRAAGGGDIDEGAAVMERLMENLEAGGKVSEDSQGLEGAQEMFANTQRLQNRII